MFERIKQWLRLGPPDSEVGFDSATQFDSLIAGVRDYAIFLLDAAGKVRSWNAGAKRIKGYRADEIIGRHFSIFYPKEAIDSNFPAHELRVASKTGRFEDEGWRLRKDGSALGQCRHHGIPERVRPSPWFPQNHPRPDGAAGGGGTGSTVGPRRSGSSSRRIQRTRRSPPNAKNGVNVSSCMSRSAASAMPSSSPMRPASSAF